MPLDPSDGPVLRGVSIVVVDDNLDARVIFSSVLRQAGGLLANRLVRLRLTGTFRNPIIQVEPLPVLTEDALRFLLGRSG